MTDTPASLYERKLAIEPDALRAEISELPWQDLRTAWKRKEAGVARDDSYDMSPQILWLDAEGNFQAAYCAPQVQRDMALVAIAVMTRHLGSETVVLSVDAHHTVNPINPSTGERWAAGEMQDACNNEGACDLGLITDTIWSTVSSRNGRHRTINRTYHVNHEAKEVHWKSLTYLDTATHGKLSGVVPQSIEDAFNTPDFSDQLPLPEGMSEAEARLHRHIAGMNLVLAINLGGAFYYAAPEDVPDAKEILEATHTEENVQRLLDGPMGELVELTRSRYDIRVG